MLCDATGRVRPLGAQAPRPQPVRRHRRGLRPLGTAALVRTGPALARRHGRDAGAGRRPRGLRGRRRRHRDGRRRAGARPPLPVPRDRDRPEPRHARRRPRADRRRRAHRPHRAGRGGRRAAAARAPLGRRAHPHLPAALRRRPGRGPAHARGGGAAGRDHGVARIRRAPWRGACVPGGSTPVSACRWPEPPPAPDGWTRAAFSARASRGSGRGTHSTPCSRCGPRPAWSGSARAV